MDHVLQDDPAHFPSIRAIAHQSEICLVFVSVYLVEGWDRDHLKLDRGGEELIKEVEKSCAGKVVVVLHTGGQVLVEDWIDLPKIAGVVWAGYPGISGVSIECRGRWADMTGQESGNALVDVLWGDVNPSGKVISRRTCLGMMLTAKLPFTMGKAVSDWPTGNILRDLASVTSTLDYARADALASSRAIPSSGVLGRFGDRLQVV